MKKVAISVIACLMYMYVVFFVYSQQQNHNSSTTVATVSHVMPENVYYGYAYMIHNIHNGKLYCSGNSMLQKKDIEVMKMEMDLESTEFFWMVKEKNKNKHGWHYCGKVHNEKKDILFLQDTVK